MERHVKSGFLVAALAFLFFSQAVTSNDKDNVRDYHQYHRRQKRQLAGLGGGESCLQIYSVPQRSVQCDPSLQVQQEMEKFKSDLQDQVSSLEQLNLKVDKIDPDKPKALPPEVRERLDNIVSLRENQADYQEALRRIDDEIRRLSERISNIEAAERQEIAKLIEQQTRLIEVTLHQSNTTLHEEYVTQLTESSHELTDKLRQLERDLQVAIDQVEDKMEGAVQRAQERAEQDLVEAKQHIGDRIGTVEEKLSVEGQTRQEFQIQTQNNKGELQNLMQLLTTLREHQVTYEQDKEQVKAVVEQIKTRLSQEQQTNERLQAEVERTSSSLEHLETLFLNLKGDLDTCTNKTNDLETDISNLAGTIKERDHILPRTLKVSDCQDALTFFLPSSGVYSINPGQAGEPFEVYCDMDKGNGWTLLLRRQDGSLDFYRDWKAYKMGFGDFHAEHWLGLDRIYAMTSRKNYKLRVELLDWDDKWWYAEYDRFSIDAEDKDYTLHVSGYQGNAGDSLSYHEGMAFSTYDRSHDLNDGICARWCHGGWWYRDCYAANLNGRYYTSGLYRTKTGWGDGVVWRALKGTNFYSVKAVIMKIAPADMQNNITPTES